MKKYLGISRFAVLSAMVSAVSAAFADTANVEVYAEVMPVCHIVGNDNLNFGQIYPDNGGNVEAYAVVNYWCTKGVNPLADVSNGKYVAAKGPVRNMRSVQDGSEYLPYEVGYSFDGTPSGGPAVINGLTIGGSVSPVDYQGALLGGYEDVIVVELIDGV